MNRIGNNISNYSTDKISTILEMTIDIKNAINQLSNYKIQSKKLNQEYK